MVVLVHDGEAVELVIPDDVVGFLEAGVGGRGDELFARRHELTDRGVHVHAGYAVIAARHEAEQFPVGACILGDGDGGEAVLLLERKHVRQRVLRREIGGARHKAGFVSLHAPNHLRLVLERLGAVNEGQAALLGQGNGERVIGDSLHDGGGHGDVQHQGAVLLALAEADKRGAEIHLVGNAAL